MTPTPALCSLPHRHKAFTPMTASPPDWLDLLRADAFAHWLQAVASQHGLQADSLRLASADASFRRYFRIDGAAGVAGGTAMGPGSYIIMDAPPAQENCAPFVQVAGLMQGAGLPAPQVLEWDAPSGFMLLTDLGSSTMMDVISPPADPLATAMPTPAHFDLYMQAVDLLVRWQLASKPSVLPAYDNALLTRELALFPEWYVGRHRGLALDATLLGRLEPLCDQIKASNLNALAGARVYVHRDFMPRNLMVDEQGALGVLDFQDAVYGPITYDIASLLRDAFLSWDEEFVLDITVRYWQHARKAGLPVGDDFGEFYRAADWQCHR